MANYKTGSKGDEVKGIQERLKELGYYKGPIDGDFGGGTEAAVRAFQKFKRLDVDGAVGPVTWKALFEEEISEPSIIKVQNGSISELVKTRILSEFKTLPANLAKEELEVQKMRIIANRRAEAAKAEWIEDVRARKLCIANGKGVVHGINYDLEGQFGVRMVEV